MAAKTDVRDGLLVSPARAAELRAASRDWPSLDLTPRQLCDLELLLAGGFAPLAGFLGRRDYERVCGEMRLASGALWPMPITLDVPADRAAALGAGARVALRDPEGVMLAALTVEEVWQPDRSAEAKAVFGTTSPAHPGVAHLLQQSGTHYMAGRLEGLALPTHYDFPELRLTPAQVRARIAARGWTKVVAFQTRNPLHRAHVELTQRAARQVGGGLLIHPVVGLTKPGDLDHYTRVRAYRALLARYPAGSVELALLPLAMRMGGPREALWHALIRRNHGCTHFIVGRDHAGPGKDPATDKPFYGPYDAQELVAKHAAEAGIAMVPFREMLYLPDRDAYVPEDEVPKGARTATLSGTELRTHLAEGRDLPAWFTYPEVERELRVLNPPRARQGFTVFFTGLPSSGKSTIANALLVRLHELGGRAVTLLDGDLVRKNLSSELGFSREHRDLNIRRIGFVAAEITKNGGAAICAPIAPFDVVRKEVRGLIAPRGGFCLVHVATPVAVCEQRDRKGLYAKARAGVIQQFTGVSDPYDVPADAELVLDTTADSPGAAAERVLGWLRGEGYLPRA